MPEDGKRYEAIDGTLCVTPAPSVRHQRISMAFVLALHRLLVDPGHGLLLAAPVGVEFPGTEEGVQPDIVFVTRDRLAIVHDDLIRGAPDLVIEIVSPATAERDRTVKRKLYQRQDVAEYWIVDGDARTVDVWALASGATNPERHLDQLPVHVAGVAVGAIQLAEIFEP